MTIAIKSTNEALKKFHSYYDEIEIEQALKLGCGGTLVVFSGTAVRFDNGKLVRNTTNRVAYLDKHGNLVWSNVTN